MVIQNWPELFGLNAFYTYNMCTALIKKNYNRQNSKGENYNFITNKKQFYLVFAGSHIHF